MTRTFTATRAVRSAVPLLVGLAGPSGCGKTFSALRLATGMRRVTNGEIFVIDTEARRALHYADQFQFQHLEFTAPFGSLDYLAAIEHCVAAGAKIIIIDSMSHEHEGPGGLLEQHAAAVKRMAGDDVCKAERVKMLAWVEPKQARRRLLNSMVQTGASLICCFRAKEKLRLERGKEPVQLGWMPIAGEEFVYEMTASVLLPAGARGVPEWHPTMPGERAMTKLPAQFAWLASAKRELDEDAGARMATWAAGFSGEEAALLGSLREASTPGQLEVMIPSLKALADGPNKATLRGVYAARKRELDAASSGNGRPPTGQETTKPDAPSPTESTDDDLAEYLASDDPTVGGGQA